MRALLHDVSIFGTRARVGTLTMLTLVLCMQILNGGGEGVHHAGAPRAALDKGYEPSPLRLQPVEGLFQQPMKRASLGLGLLKEGSG